MTESLSETALKLAPWSISKAGLAASCPFAFNMKYVTFTKGQVSLGGGIFGIGSALHSVLESHLKGEPLDNIKKIAIDACNYERLTTNEVEKVAENLRNVKSFIRRIESFKAKHSIQTSLIEKNFSFGKDFVPTEYNKPGEIFKGVWDVVMFPAGTDDVIVIDHKSGEMPSDEFEIWNRHGKQRRAYALGAMSAFPNAKRVRFAIHYIYSEQIVWAKEVDTIDRIKDVYVPWYYEYLNGCAAKAMTKQACKNWMCNSCVYRMMCS